MSKWLKIKAIYYSLFLIREDDEIIENNELERVIKHKQQRTTWSKKRSDNNTNYNYVLPNVSRFSNSKFF